MANTYTLIASNTLGSSAASVTFSSIPNTYTDLVLRMSARSSVTGVVSDPMRLTFNSDSGSNYSDTLFRGTGSSVASFNDSNSTVIWIYNSLNAAGSTSSTFSNTEIYIPSYTASQNKPASAFGLAENNATEAYIAAHATLWRNTAAITSLTIQPNTGNNFVSGSSFFLYGIKNS